MVTAASMQVGALEVIALRDAAADLPGPRDDAFVGASDHDWGRAQAIDPEAFASQGRWHLAFTCFAIRRPGSRVMIVDTGVGGSDSPAAAWAPVPGSLPDELDRAGIERADVDVVVLTHLHEDHCGWVVDEQGRPLFPDAHHVVQQTELENLRADPDDTIWRYAVEPLEQAGLLRPIDGRRRVPGGGHGGARIDAVPTPGHTAGHQSVLLESRGHRMLVTGDVLVHAVQLVNPSVAYELEQDPAVAARTRRRQLGLAARTGSILATAHLNRPFVDPASPLP